MRADYVAACEKLLTDSPQGLLVTLEYEPISMEGPPFSVATAEVDRLWKGQLVLVEQLDMLASMPRAIASGVRRLDEYLWVFR
jgi:thiopurine S-methyltransferase